MIQRPPATQTDAFSRVLEQPEEHRGQYLSLFAPLDSEGRYLPFDELRFRLPTGLDIPLAWSVVRMARDQQVKPVLELGEPPTFCRLLLTPCMQKAISETDRHTTSAALEWLSSKIGEKKHVQYLINDLIEDEAISSSQLEGASTTTLVAKALLKQRRGPRTPDEKMIVGNYRMMQFAWEKRHQPLSVELICELHYIGTQGIDDEKYRPGALKQTDDVIVADADNNIIHQPPPARTLPRRLTRLAEWANSNQHDVEDNSYLHPLLKAIVLHFAIGYEHPFHDGNGRVARALFYWYLFRQEFAAFRYIAISTLLKKAPIQYGKSYLFTETDGMDLTYFADYQCRIVLRAIAAFKEACSKAVRNIEAFNAFMFQSGLLRKLSDKQIIVFQVAKSGSAQEFTARSVEHNLACSYNTARDLLNGLVELGLFTKSKVGREWVYRMLDSQQIVRNWQA